jgi:predicted DNA-binding transcriptional regulator AlpA
MLGNIIACQQTLMAESTDRHFLRPRELLSANRIDFFDAINLVIYAKLPLLTVLKGRDLVAGYLRRDGTGGIRPVRSFPGETELIGKYARYVDGLTFPVGPQAYEPLLDLMSRGNEQALPYFFHEHHLIVDRRRRAALFALAYKELQSDVMKGTVILQLTEAERAPMLLSGAWMTNETLKKYLHQRGVLPWWGNEKNLSSHALLERMVMSDSLTASRVSTSSQERQAPQRLPEPFNTRSIPPLNQTQGPEKTREAASPDRNLPEPAGVASSAPINLGLLQRILAAFTPAARSDAKYRTNSNEGLGSIDQLKSETSTQASSASDQQQDRLPPSGTHADKQHRDGEMRGEAVAVEVRLIEIQTTPEHEVYDEEQAPSFLLAEKLLKSSRFRVGASAVLPTTQTGNQQAKAAAFPGLPAQTRQDQVTSDAQPREVKVNAAESPRPTTHRQIEGVGKADISIPKRESKSGLDLRSEAHEPVQENDAYSDETLLTREEVAAFINRHVNSVDNYRKRPDFPPPVFIGDSPMWKRGQIRKWMDRKSAK